MDAIRLVEKCYNLLPPNKRACPWEYTDHGRKVLETEDELNAYLAAYGEIHIVKCRAALQNFPFSDLKTYRYEIFDWGCGQGIATLTLLDMLYERKMLYGLKRITLIEPSPIALDRAKNWAQQFAGPGVTIKSVNKYIPSHVEDAMEEVLCREQVSINLFSNVLDIRNISLAWLAGKTSSLAIRNYMICIGPKFSKGTNTRLADFCGYFQPKDCFSSINEYPYAYTTRTHHPFGCETRCFIHQSSDSLNKSYVECADEPTFQDDYDYAANCLKGVISDSLLHLYNEVRQKCNQSYSIFLRPAVNSDRLDLVMAGLGKGIIILNVCEKLENLEEEYNRLEAIKSNIFNSHLRTIKVDSIINKSVFNCVKVAMYIPKVSVVDVNIQIESLNRALNERAKKKIEILRIKIILNMYTSLRMIWIYQRRLIKLSRKDSDSITMMSW